MMAAMLSVSAISSTAFAQESDSIEDRQLHQQTILSGVGGVVNEEDQGKRSYFKIGIVPTSDSETEFDVKRGAFMVGKHDNREKYTVVAESWQISVSADKLSYAASGTVENKEGKFYDVRISGDKISDLENGVLYYVTGTAINDNDEVYNLFYISALTERIPSIQATS